MIARRLLQRPRTNSASHPCVGSTVSIVCDGLVTADSARLPDFVSAVARNVTYASVGREALLPFRITEYRRSCADFMFLANASSAELESCWDARNLLALPLSVADTPDAMTRDRPYRNSMPRAQVRRVFEKGAAIHWDPVVVDAYYVITGDCCEQDDVPFNPPRCFAATAMSVLRE